MARALLKDPCEQGDTMQLTRRQVGVTMIEMMVIVAIIGLLAAVSVPLFQQTRSALRVKAATRSMADLLVLARTEAIRTGVNHAVYFWVDPLGGALTDPAGNRVAAVLTADADTDGLIDAGEMVSWVPADPLLAWGVGPAAGVGPPTTDPDPNNQFTSGWTFRDPNGNDIQWVVFNPDGIPRGFSVGPYDDGGAAGIGGGNGAVYVTDGSRDYAVVLTALGSVRVHVFDASQNQWRS